MLNDYVLQQEKDEWDDAFFDIWEAVPEEERESLNDQFASLDFLVEIAPKALGVLLEVEAFLRRRRNQSVLHAAVKAVLDHWDKSCDDRPKQGELPLAENTAPQEQ